MSRLPDRDYSHRTLLEKLGVRSGQRIAALNVSDAAFLDDVSRTAGESISTVLRGTYDLIFLQVNEARDLGRIPKAASHLQAAGALWIFHPKGKNAAVKEGEVRTAYLACGVVDNKVSAFTETHTATRCVIPRVKR
ncbi:MAG TPA: hypothetical protein VGZ02_08035 [Candidatus Baltobacteraceae bacterium]|jgi:hypothetical protein|nr:hypothetical protein [Candidatus Baltobacteraceae bacterium]